MKRIRLSEEQCMLKDNARLMLANARNASAAAPSAASWSQISELGWPAILVPEKYDGLEFGFLSMALLLEEMGAVCLPGPFFATAVSSVLVLQELASEEHKAQWLPNLASGASTMTLAIQEGDSEFDFNAIQLAATAADGGYRLNGRKEMVPDAANVDYLLVLARCEQQANHYDLYLMPRKSDGLSLTPLHTINGTSDCSLQFDNVTVDATAKLNAQAISAAALVRMLSMISVAKSAEMVGGAASSMTLAVEHAKERRQFGAPIGAFQAIQHHCVNMLVQVESARRITHRAASQIDEGEFEAGDIARAKAWTNQAYREVVRLAHQVLGGVGYCEDHAMPDYFRHARYSEASFGDTDTLQEIVAAGLLGQ
ncbi:MAG: acyl-CoA dehydrogenase family protein [Pseudomonadota bacterium]